MAEYDLGSNVVGGQSIVPASHTTTQTGAFVDTQGYLTAMALIDVTTLSTADAATNLFTFTVTGSDVAAGTSPVTLATTSMTNPLTSSWATAVGTSVVWDLKIDNTTDTNLVHTFGIVLKGFAHRYINIVATATGSPSAIFGASIILGTPMHSPAVLNNVTA